MSTLLASVAMAINYLGSGGATVFTTLVLMTGITSAVERQSGAARTIAHNVDTASDGTRRVYGDIERVASSAESTGRTADEVMRSASAVNQKATDLRSTVDSFLQKLRSA